MTNPTQTFAAMIEIVTACITHQDVSVNDVPGLISKIHKSLSVIDGFTLSLEEKPKRSFVNKAVAKPVMAEDQLPVVTVASATLPAVRRPIPAVPILQSVFRDRIICLKDGTTHVMMKQHLRRVCGMTPKQYRTKWGLPDNSERQRQGAKKVGLGTLANKRGHLSEDEMRA